MASRFFVVKARSWKAAPRQCHRRTTSAAPTKVRREAESISQSAVQRKPVEKLCRRRRPTARHQSLKAASTCHTNDSVFRVHVAARHGRSSRTASRTQQRIADRLRPRRSSKSVMNAAASREMSVAAAQSVCRKLPIRQCRRRRFFGRSLAAEDVGITTAGNVPTSRTKSRFDDIVRALTTISLKFINKKRSARHHRSRLAFAREASVVPVMSTTKTVRSLVTYRGEGRIRLPSKRYRCFHGCVSKPRFPVELVRRSAGSESLFRRKVTPHWVVSRVAESGARYSNSVHGGGGVAEESGQEIKRSASSSKRVIYCRKASCRRSRTRSINLNGQHDGAGVAAVASSVAESVFSPPPSIQRSAIRYSVPPSGRNTVPGGGLMIAKNARHAGHDTKSRVSPPIGATTSVYEWHHLAVSRGSGVFERQTISMPTAYCVAGKWPHDRRQHMSGIEAATAVISEPTEFFTASFADNGSQPSPTSARNVTEMTSRQP